MFGVKEATLDSVKGGSAKQNAEIIRDIFSGKDKGPRRDIVLMNASVALMAAGEVKDYEEGALKASVAIDSGGALGKLEELIKLTNNA